MLKAFHKEGIFEAGVDEAGRGCLAGPVVAAAVILSPDFYHPLLNDSKKVSEKDRYILRPIIEESAISWAVAEVGPARIDEINILNASFEAMNIAVMSLSIAPELLLIDGNRFKNKTDFHHECIIKGDGIYSSIAAASILAKTYRDDLMLQLHESHQQYAWHKNKGYPTKEHRIAIELFGATTHHRKTFRLLANSDQLDLF